MNTAQHLHNQKMTLLINIQQLEAYVRDERFTVEQMHQIEDEIYKLNQTVRNVDPS